MTTDERLAELTQQVVDHLAGRPVKIRWENPPSQSAAGQTTKSISGDLTIHIGNLTDAESRLRTLVHECAHSFYDYSTIPVTGTQAPGSIRRSPEDRKVWIMDPREERAKKQADEWIQYAELYAHRHWRVGRSAMECKLLALLDWNTGE